MEVCRLYELTVARRQNGKQRDDLTLARWFSGMPVDAGADEIWGRIIAKASDVLRVVKWTTPEDLQDRPLTLTLSLDSFQGVRSS